MNKISLQKFLFDSIPTRTKLLSYKKNNKCKQITIKIIRNHSFELIENTISAYLDYAELNIKFDYSDYDDLLSFDELTIKYDAIIIWVDLSRYKTDDVLKFIKLRISNIRDCYSGPIMLATLGDVNFNYIPNTNEIYLNLDQFLCKEKIKYLDQKFENYTGTKLSRYACLFLSKVLGLRYLPYLVKPPLKAIFLDLDNTIYSGVLGEDGIDGIVLDKKHELLQLKLQELSNNFLICIVSKNDFIDVEKLFNKRKDFPLKKESITKFFVSWKPKSFLINEALKFLNIKENSCLFIDDNIGEISEVMSSLPDIKFILADKDAGKTLDNLMFYPGLYNLNCEDEGIKRRVDIQANEHRTKLKETLSLEEFFKELKMIITIKINSLNDIKRFAQLGNKTNQFIFTYRRYSEVKLQKLIKDPNIAIISIFLKDNLSDSGMICGIILKKNGRISILDELFVSCRALGRGIESQFIFKALCLGMEYLETTILKTTLVNGERNLPATMFYSSFLKSELNYTELSSRIKNSNFLTFVCEDNRNDKT